MPDLDLVTGSGSRPPSLRAAVRRQAGATQSRRARRLWHRSMG